MSKNNSRTKRLVNSKLRCRKAAPLLLEAVERRTLLSGTVYPLSDVPQLSSLPGAPATIYLNFTGAAAQTWFYQSVPATPAYDIDGDPTTFSQQELTNISQIWAIVAEAYSPFDVNVTTVDPSPIAHYYPAGQVVQEIIGGNGSWAGSSETGISYTGGFTAPQSLDINTNFVFSDETGGNVWETAEVAAHEDGHMFGLNHQSLYSAQGQFLEEYNPGTSAAAPIMGNSLASSRGLWWDGPDDQGYNDIQDDMAVISGSANGFGYRPLTIGQSAGAATPLSISGGSVSGSGVIDSTSQTDYYSFSTGSGTDTFNVNVAQYGPMLQAKLELFNSSGTLLATAADANTLGQTLTANLTAGNYYLVVESYGQYGDVGQYTLSGTVVGQGGSPPSDPTIAISGAASINEQASYTLNLSASDPGQTISSWSINWGDGNTQTVSGDPTSVTHAYATGPNTYTIQASATDGTGTYSAGNTVSVSVLHVVPTLSISGASSVNQGSLYSLLLSASDLHNILSWTINWGDGDTQTVSGNPSSITHTYATGPNSYTIQACATDNVGTYSSGNTQSVSVLYVAPTLTLSGAASVNEGASYLLNLSASDGGHTISSWAINWGDGTGTQNVSGNPSSVTHVYLTAPLTATITATATDDQGTHSAGNTVITTVNAVPVSIALSAATSVNQGSPFSLALASVFDVSGTPIDYVIHWGDGTSSTVNALGTYSHVFTTAGSENLSVDVIDNNGTHGGVGTWPLNVAAVPFTLNISGPASISVAQTYTLALAASEPLNETVSQWTINWGDGSAAQTISGNPASVTHQFAGAGNYVISASAVNGQGTATSNTLTVQVASLPVDMTAPTASGSFANLTAANQSTYTFEVTYTDNVAIDAATLGNSNVIVTGPDGYLQTATLVSVNAPGNGAVRIATYSVPAPDGTWSSADNGTYTVTMHAGAVTDTSGNAVAPVTLGLFQVNVPPSLGTVTTNTRASASDTLSNGGQDLRTLTLTQPQVVTFTLTGQRAGVSAQITDGNGNVILSKPRAFSSAVTLGPGTYNITIDYTGKLSSKYTFTALARAVPARVSAAASAVPGTQNSYWFTLAQAENVTIALNAKGAVNVEVLDIDGNVVFSQSGAKFSSKVTLAAGSYSLQVSYDGVTVSRYLVTTANSPVSAGRAVAKKG